MRTDGVALQQARARLIVEPSATPRDSLFEIQISHKAIQIIIPNNHQENVMKYITAGMLFAGIVAMSSPVLADDAATAPTQKHNTMKECVMRQKAKDSTISDEDAKAQCQKQVDMKKSGNDLTSAPPAPTPNK
jgi:hypothetical protein